ncbi:Cas10/Cmr2 second palm domain-containing protein [Streptomyces sp. NPDC004838]
MRVQLVSFEAWNITRFMFVTGKRREIAGASELITYVDRVWVRAALRDLCEGFTEEWRIETCPVELLSTGAGTARVLVREGEEDLARRLVGAVTLAALRQAPGLDVYGVVGEPFEWDAEGALHAACAGAVGALDRVRMGRVSVEARFLRLPLVDECASTGLPAAVLAKQPDGGSEPRSAESQAKWVAYGRMGQGEGLNRLAALAGTDPRQLGQVVQWLGERADWVGLVYADGNGLGRVFGDFAACVPGRGNRLYADTLREFTRGLQGCAERAFTEAVAEVTALVGDQGGGAAVPRVLPLILGGDDVVALCDGEWALPFTRAYLAAYERMTGEDQTVAAALRLRGGSGRVAASAGVAVVKSHFPFVAAAGLAYELMVEAKQVKQRVPEVACSGLAFHVLYDSSGADLERIRAGSVVNGATLVAQPYVVSEDVPEDNGWARGRRWADLAARVEALKARGEDGEPLLPASQLHDLREGLFSGPEVADARLTKLMRRFSDRGLRELTSGERSLFWREPGPDPGAAPDAGRRVTGLLDAMAAKPFLFPGGER